MNRAPKLFTILIAAILVIAGVLGTFVHLYDEHVGAWLYVAASFVMVLGIIFRGI
jgi:hypothetical protein